MVKKSEQDIMEKLHALNPSVPTYTRLNVNREKEEDVNLKQFEAGYLAVPEFYHIFAENLHALEKMRNIMIENTGKIFLVAIDNWHRFMNIYYGMVESNLFFFKNVVKNKSDKIE